MNKNYLLRLAWTAAFLAGALLLVRRSTAVADVSLGPDVVAADTNRVYLRAETGIAPPPIRPPAGFLEENEQTADIIIDFQGSWDASARAAFEYAAGIWETLIISSLPIVIEAHWLPMPPGYLGGATAYHYIRDFANAPYGGTWYAVATANALSGSDQNIIGGTDYAEIYTEFSSTFGSWYFGTDGNPPSNKYDFATVALHEIGHGLGFAGSMVVDGGLGEWGYGTGYPFIYDRYAINGSNQSLITAFGNPSAALAGQLTGGNVFFNGAKAKAANGGANVKLYAPGSWQQGSSYSHLDESYNGTVNALMTYSLLNGEANHDPGPITLGMLSDNGWPAAPNTAPTLSPLPDKTLDRGDILQNAIDLWTYASDAQSPDSQLTFAITNTPNAYAGVAIDGNRYVDILPNPCWTGSTNVTVRVTDPGGLTASDTFNVTVNPAGISAGRHASPFNQLPEGSVSIFLPFVSCQ